jgi:hypothetical protein
MKTGELNEHATVLPITYWSSLTSRVATPTVPSPIARWASGRCAVVLGAYREPGRMARVVQRRLCEATDVARGWRYAETVRCRGERVSGRREYGGERAEAGAGINRNNSEINRKSTTLLTGYDCYLYTTTSSDLDIELEVLVNGNSTSRIRGDRLERLQQPWFGLVHSTIRTKCD